MKYLFDAGETMRKVVQVCVTKGDNQYVAECLDLPVVTQAKTLDELVKNINEALALYFEGEDPAKLEL